MSVEPKLPTRTPREVLLHRFVSHASLTHVDALIAWCELDKFLQACIKAPFGLTPSKIIDEIWHEFILHTTDYARFCTERLGLFVHHVPTDSPDVANYRRTLTFLEAQYNEPLDKRFWPKIDAAAGDCNSSCSGKDCGSSCSN